MKKTDRFLLGLALIYIAMVGIAYLYPSPSLIRSTLQPTMPLLSGLVALIVLYCAAIIVRIYLQSNHRPVRYLDRIFASLLAGTVLAGEPGSFALIYSLAVFIAFCVFLNQRQMNDEVELRKARTLREIGLDPNRNMPLLTMLVLLSSIGFVAYVWVMQSHS